jgi:magnesium transporter
MITVYQRTINSRRLKVVEDYKAGAWVHVESPTTEEIAMLAEKLTLDVGLLSDALDPYEVPRIETDKGVTYFFTRLPFDDAGKISTTPILLILTKEHVVSVSKLTLPFFQSFIEGKKEFHTTQKIRFLLQILSEVDAAFARYITLINKEVRRLSANLTGSISNEDILTFVNFESVLNDLLDALTPTNAALQKILSGKLLTMYETDRDFVEDVYLENGQLIELCRSNIRAIVNIRNAYSTIMGNTLNRVIKVLTALTIVFTIPTIFFNIYGMNIPLPFQESPHAFWIVVLMTTIGTTIAVWVFIRKSLL